MMMDFKYGWLNGCHFMPSNHYHQPPNSRETIRLIVLHCISLPVGVYDNYQVEHLFTGDMSGDDATSLHAIVSESGRVSAHFYIKRSGERIQFVPIHYCAWHAGISVHDGEHNCNHFSIGIELQGQIDEPYTPYQYQSLSRIVLALQKKLPKLRDMEKQIVGHSDIAPQRKQDPGKSFDWHVLSALLTNEEIGF